MSTQANITILNSQDFQKLLDRLQILEDKLDRLSKRSSLKTYSDKEVQEILKVSGKTLANYRNQGKIGFVRLEEGRRIIYTEGHLAEFLGRNEWKTF